MAATQCRHFLAGSCRFGANCRFSHDVPPPRAAGPKGARGRGRGGRGAIRVELPPPPPDVPPPPAEAKRPQMRVDVPRGRGRRGGGGGGRGGVPAPPPVPVVAVAPEPPRAPVPDAFYDTSSDDDIAPQIEPPPGAPDGEAFARFMRMQMEMERARRERDEFAGFEFHPGDAPPVPPPFQFPQQGPYPPYMQMGMGGMMGLPVMPPGMPAMGRGMPMPPMGRGMPMPPQRPMQPPGQLMQAYMEVCETMDTNFAQGFLMRLLPPERRALTEMVRALAVGQQGGTGLPDVTAADFEMLFGHPPPREGDMPDFGHVELEDDGPVLFD